MFVKKSTSHVFSILFVLALILSLTGQAQAAEVSPLSALPITVNSNADTQAQDSQCTLREAILNANGDNQSGSTDCASGSGADTINFSLSYPATITLTSELPAIAGGLTIEGPGRDNLTISGDEAVRVLTINSGAALELKYLTVAAGKTTGGSGGGGVLVSAGGSLNVEECKFSNNNASGPGGAILNSGSFNVVRSTFSENHANFGGAIASGEASLYISDSTFDSNTATTGGGAINNYHSTTFPVTITRSTFSNNSSSNQGGGIYNDNAGTLNIVNSTFHNNSAPLGGGISNANGATLNVTHSTFSSSGTSPSGTLQNFSGTVTFRNSILAHDVGGGGANCTGTLTADSYNRATDSSCGSATPTSLANLKLGPLQDNGGDTLTFALPATSYAIDAGDDAICATALVGGLDQRGMTRPQGAHCDVGAYERQQISGFLYAIPEEGATSGICDSWVSACNLQYALSIAGPGAEIWAQAGTYKPTTGTDRNATFKLESGALYGGFAGTETARSQRDPALNVTTLSGDLNGDDGPNFANNSENSYHVVIVTYTDASVTLDGFTITGGNTDGVVLYEVGGGMLNIQSSPIVTNVTFSGNSASYGGGGMYNNESSPIVTNVTFSNNSAAVRGGGMYNEYSSLTGANVTFSGNSAITGGGMHNIQSSAIVTNVTFSGNSALRGGGMYNSESSPTVTNVTFSGNSATDCGGGMRNHSNSSPTVTNVTFNGNSANLGGGMCNGGSSNPIIHNSILWGNTATISGSQVYNDSSTPVITYSNVQDGCPSGSICTNLISTDPLLGVLGDYGGSTQIFPLLPGSPAINAGDNATCAAADQRGTARPQGIYCDMGAYEADVTAPVIKSVVRVNASPTSLTSVGFTVTFSEPVTGVDTADFKLTNTLLTGAVVTGATGSGAAYTVTVNTGTGNGTIRLDIPVTAGIQDLAENAFVGPYAGATYTINKGTAPTVPVLKSPANKALVPTFTPTLNWDDSSEVMALAVLGWHYEIQVTSPDGYNQTFNTVDNPDPLLGLGESQYTFTSPLPANGTFSWRVRAYNDHNQYSAWSLMRTFRTKLSAPVLNLPLNGAPLNNKRPTFEWDEVPGATTYTLQVLKDGKVVVTGKIKAPAYTYTPAKDLLPSMEYTWKVKANGTSGGDYSAPSTFTTSVNPPKVPTPSAPANNALVDGSVGQAFKWGAVLEVVTPASPSAASYEAEYATNASFINSSPTVKVNAPATETAPITLLPGRAYYWHVRSWSGADGTGNHSAWSKTRIIKVKFVAPTLTSPVADATNVSVRPTFTWSSTNGLWTFYTLQIAPDNVFGKGTRTIKVNAPTTKYTIPDSLPALSAGIQYCWRVKINGVYTAIASPSQCFTTAP